MLENLFICSGIFFFFEELYFAYTKYKNMELHDKEVQLISASTPIYIYWTVLGLIASILTYKIYVAMAFLLIVGISLVTKLIHIKIKSSKDFAAQVFHNMKIYKTYVVSESIICALCILYIILWY
jgi:hypothetical protein